MDIVVESGGYAQISASGNVWPSACAMTGIFVSSASGTPTITIYDDAATGTSVPLVATFTPVAGTYYKLPFRALLGLNVVIGGTIACTVGFQAETLH
jgi:hypothetical protein